LDRASGSVQGDATSHGDHRPDEYQRMIGAALTATDSLLTE
jgi:hypothetical protein